MSAEGSMPNPTVWPLCSTCESTWALRRVIDVMSGRSVWMWTRDCKHKSAAPVLVDEGGPVQVSGPAS